MTHLLDVQCTPYIVRRIMYDLFYVVRNIMTLNVIQYTMYTVRLTVYDVYCTSCIVGHRTHTRLVNIVKRTCVQAPLDIRCLDLLDLNLQYLKYRISLFNRQTTGKINSTTMPAYHMNRIIIIIIIINHTNMRVCLYKGL